VSLSASPAGTFFSPGAPPGHSGIVVCAEAAIATVVVTIMIAPIRATHLRIAADAAFAVDVFAAGT
jgi:hypothetical protein